MFLGIFAQIFYEKNTKFPLRYPRDIVYLPSKYGNKAFSIAANRRLSHAPFLPPRRSPMGLFARLTKCKQQKDDINQNI